MDLVLKDLLKKDEEYVIIEMNREYSEASENKSVQYLFRKMGNGFDEGEDYISPPRVKLIMFNNYKSKELNGKIDVARYELLCQKYNLRKEIIEIHEIYLKLFHELCYDDCSKIDKRLWLFGTKSFDEMKNVINNDNKYIIEELERLSVNNKFRDEYDYENVQRKLCNSMKIEGYNEGVSQGISQGISQGKQNKAIEIAQAMINKKMDLKVVSELTQLSIKELEKLTFNQNLTQ